MREHGVPQFTVDAHRPVARLRRPRRHLLHRAGLHQPATALDLAGIPLHSADRTTTTRSSSPAGMRRSTPSRSPTSSTPRCSATASRPCSRSPSVIREWKQRGLSRRARRAAAAARRDRRRLRARVLRRDVPARRPDRAGRARTGPASRARVRKHTADGPRRWPYPKKPLVVPLAETVHERYSVEIFRGCTRGCRFCQAGMITRPVRERSIATIGDDGRERPAVDRLRRGRPAVAVAARTTARSARSPSGLADRYEGTERRPLAAVAPGSTRSTSPWPTSCPATAGARA